MEKAVDCSKASEYKYTFSRTDSDSGDPLSHQTLPSTLSFQCCVCVASSYSFGPIETHFAHYAGSIYTTLQGLLLVSVLSIHNSLHLQQKKEPAMMVDRLLQSTLGI